MNYNRTWYQKYYSYISSTTIRRIKSKKNGLLTLRYTNGRIVLDTRNANFSFNEVHFAFKKVINNIIKDSFIPQNVLVLGMGGGSIVSILHNELELDCQITAVEYDHTIIQIAKTYFNIEENANLKIIEDDAFKFIANSNQKYGIIFVDIFNDTKVPPSFITQQFATHLSDSLEANGKVIFNVIQNNQRNKILFFFSNLGLKTKLINTIQRHKMVFGLK